VAGKQKPLFQAGLGVNSKLELLPPLGFGCFFTIHTDKNHYIRKKPAVKVETLTAGGLYFRPLN